eukprot:CAMPEP_0183468372 /NCGR_PEP_ID=MMETSP0370-20130417/152635_1 /TAXON_ID=268820 /ORGANISM="Peridinium aciculiferum, Strain PAER-2" /LENGTH=106 /DNA_ID=CAMNT_0025660763 /DNA_START=34 /DNA_END=353 /DNA_ORIENTATION=+
MPPISLNGRGAMVTAGAHCQGPEEGVRMSLPPDVGDGVRRQAQWLLRPGFSNAAVTKLARGHEAVDRPWRGLPRRFCSAAAAPGTTAAGMASERPRHRVRQGGRVV